MPGRTKFGGNLNYTVIQTSLSINHILKKTDANFTPVDVKLIQCDQVTKCNIVSSLRRYCGLPYRIMDTGACVAQSYWYLDPLKFLFQEIY